MADDMDDTDRFVQCVLSNEHNRTILDRAPELGAPDWWLTAGAVFQTVWNCLDARAPGEGIRDYDLFYFDDGDLEEHFGVPARAFTSTADAIDHFASTTCCYALNRGDDGEMSIYAPHGYADLFGQRVRPNPVLASREVYETKAARWIEQWPRLVVEPWPRQKA